MAAGNAQQVSHLWKYVAFPLNFPTVPLVFAQTVSENEASAVVVQTRNITEYGFEIRLVEEEGGDQLHLGEIVSWMAVETGIMTDGSFFSAQMAGGIGHTAQSISFLNTYPSPPVFITSLNSTTEADPCAVMTDNETDAGLSISLEEETSLDS